MTYIREELEGKTDRTLMMMCQDRGITYGRSRPSKGRMIRDLLVLQSKMTELVTPSPKAEEELEKLGIETPAKKARKPKKEEPEDRVADEGVTEDRVMDESGPIGDGD